jgi:hypothetical protein
LGDDDIMRTASSWIFRRLLLFFFVALAMVSAVAPPKARELGALRIVVIQSDDWGFEGWFPDSLAAASLVDLTTSLPPRLAPYAQSTLESAADVESLKTLLQSIQGVSGLSAVMQANTVVAGPDLDDRVAPESSVGWPFHPSGVGHGAYFRPGLRESVDAAIEAGVWRPELHGLTHFDLFAYAAARRRGDRTERRARELGVLAYEDWMLGTELGDADPERASSLAVMATVLFERRFDRRPASVIAPDYRWTRADEEAWAAVGISVVQAKREQVDPGIDLASKWGRLQKWVRGSLDRHRARFTYLDRPARLEPYGSEDPFAQQGAMEAAAAIRAAWSRGEPGVLSIHRVQLSSLDPAIAAAGRKQLRRCIEELQSDGSLRFLVDAEVSQLLRRGWSQIQRGETLVFRNHTGQAVRLDDPLPDGRRVLPPGTSLFPMVPSRAGFLPPTGMCEYFVKSSRTRA